MQKSEKRNLRRSVIIFHSFKEQDEADERYYKRLSPEKKLQELEEIRNFNIKMRYGYLPRLRRVYKITKRK